MSRRDRIQAQIEEMNSAILTEFEKQTDARIAMAKLELTSVQYAPLKRASDAEIEVLEGKIAKMKRELTELVEASESEGGNSDSTTAAQSSSEWQRILEEPLDVVRRDHIGQWYRDRLGIRGKAHLWAGEVFQHFGLEEIGGNSLRFFGYPIILPNPIVGIENNHQKWKVPYIREDKRLIRVAKHELNLCLNYLNEINVNQVSWWHLWVDITKSLFSEISIEPIVHYPLLYSMLHERIYPIRESISSHIARSALDVNDWRFLYSLAGLELLKDMISAANAESESAKLRLLGLLFSSAYIFQYLSETEGDVTFLEVCRR